jgi:transposase
MDIAVLGVDLGKNVCSLVGLDASGAVVMRRKARRETLIALAERLAPCVVGIEACCGAHHLGRVFAAHGHDVRLMSPEYVRPCGNPNGISQAQTQEAVVRVQGRKDLELKGLLGRDMELPMP